MKLLDLKLLNYAQEFDREQQILVGANRSARSATLPVGDCAGEIHFPLLANAHHLQRFGPTGDHLVHGELRWFATLVGTIEDFAIRQFPVVMARDNAPPGGLRADRCRSFAR